MGQAPMRRKALWHTPSVSCTPARSSPSCATRKFNSELKKLQARPLYSDEMLRTAEAYVDYLTGEGHAYAGAAPCGNGGQG